MLQLKIEHITWNALDTATFALSEVNGRKIVYRAGQFITLVFDHHRQELRRSYSISSSPLEPLLCITIKRVPNGELSRFLLTHAKPGDIWQAEEPAGRFVTDTSHLESRIFLFAAGSGITPIYAQIKYLLAQHIKSSLILIYSNRNRQSILFRDELEVLEKQHPGRLSIIHLLSDEGRRLNNVAVEELTKRHAGNTLFNAGFYLCGPFDYMRMVRLTLIFMGISPQHIRKENFVIDTVPVRAKTRVYAPHNVRINFRGESYDIRTGENQSVLQAALQNNIPLPYSCRVGICSSCAGMCNKGKIEITANEVLTDAELAAGWVLTCTGYALDDDVVIDMD